MNRAGRPSFTLSTLLALLALALLVSCGDSGGNGGRPEVGGGDTADTGGGDSAVTDTGDEDVPVDDDVPPECTEPAQCTELTLAPCMEAACQDGDCVAVRATEAPACCQDDEECEDGTCPTPGEACVPDTPTYCDTDATLCEDIETFPGLADANACETPYCDTTQDPPACALERQDPAPPNGGCCLEDAECDDGDDNTEDSCPTPGDPCLNEWICLVDDDCADAFEEGELNACETPVCDTDEGTCVKERTAPEPNGGCCLNAAECNDGNPETNDSCPEPGGPCLNDVELCSEAADPDQFCYDRIGPADTCETIRCVADECVLESEQGQFCCITRADCPEGDGWQCPEIGGRCELSITCDDTVTAFTADFDSGTLGTFEVFDLNPTDDVTWTVVEDEVYAGFSAYLGDPRCGWYFNGDQVDEDCDTPYVPEQDPDHASRVSVELVTPEFELPNDAEGNPLPYALGFWIMGESETPFPGLPDEFQPDALVVSVEDTSTGFLDVVFRSSDYGNAIVQPLHVGADLTVYAGKAVRVHFAFDTFDGNDNRNPGWWIDDVTVESFCGTTQCEQNVDCADTDGCTVDTCTLFENGTGGFCAQYLLSVDCIPCEEAADCDSGDECRIGSCIPDGQPREGTCTFAASGAPECCSEIDVIDAAFDGGALPAGWAVEDDGSDVKWRVVSDEDAGRTALYFGDPATGTYNNGDRAAGRVSTGTVTLPDQDVTPFVSLITTWELNLSTEFDDETWNPNVAVDRLSLLVAYEDAEGALIEDEIWSSAAVEGTTMGEWVAVGADLTSYAGMEVEFVFQFDSDDELSNDYGGAWIDSFMVRASCQQPCQSDAECDDGIVCTNDACVAGECTNVFAYADCCATVADCGASDDCTDVTCEGMGTMGVPNAGVCTYRDDNDNGTCCDQTGGVTYSNTIPIEDLAGAGYAIEVGDHGDALNAVMWQASDVCMVSPPYGLYFGDEVFESYESGYQVSGAVTTPQIKLPSSGPAAKTWLEFELFLDTEWRGAQFEGWVDPPPVIRDQLKLSVVQGAQENEVWSSFALDVRGSTCRPGQECGWETVRVDMTEFQSYSLRLKFEFDSADDIDNAGLGVCIDDLRIVTDCSGQQDIDCFGSEECDDGDECTWDFCQEDFTCHFPSTGDPTCCAIETLESYDWDDGTDQGWTYSQPVDTVQWQVTDFTDADTGGFFLYFGDESAQSYDVPGEAVSGAATSPSIQLPESEELTVSFAYYLDIEPPSATFPNRDAFEVRVISNFTGAERVLVSKATIPVQNIGATPPQWFTWTGGIPTEYAGDIVVFEIRFNSNDEIENTGLGVLIDSFVVEGEICP